MQNFIIDGKLPGYNELHQQPWYKSRRIKQNAMDTVMWYARIAGLKPIQGRCTVTITCYEPNARRDVRPVVRGKWEWDGGEDMHYYCSCCHFNAYGCTCEILDGKYNFCPNCGADMREGQEWRVQEAQGWAK